MESDDGWPDHRPDQGRRGGGARSDPAARAGASASIDPVAGCGPRRQRGDDWRDATSASDRTRHHLSFQRLPVRRSRGALPPAIPPPAAAKTSAAASSAVASGPARPAERTSPPALTALPQPSPAAPMSVADERAYVANGHLPALPLTEPPRPQIAPGPPPPAVPVTAAAPPPAERLGTDVDFDRRSATLNDAALADVKAIAAARGRPWDRDHRIWRRVELGRSRPGGCARSRAATGSGAGHGAGGPGCAERISANEC